MTMPRLTGTLPGPRHWRVCQSCAGVGHHVEGWLECGDDDRPQDVVVYLCPPCSVLLVEPHPRLYRRLQRHEPVPGYMPLCEGCAHHRPAGPLLIRCQSPQLMRNGGQGMTIGPGGTMAHVQRATANGRRCEAILMYHVPQTTCTGREAACPEGASGETPAS